MATLTLSAVTQAGTVSRARTLSETDASRLIAWAKAQYGPSLTNAQAFQAMADAVFAGLKANVLAHEQAQATTTALAGISDITLT